MKNEKTWRGEAATGTDWPGMTLSWINQAKGRTLETFLTIARMNRSADFLKMLPYVGVIEIPALHEDQARAFFAAAQTIDPKAYLAALRSAS